MNPWKTTPFPGDVELVGTCYIPHGDLKQCRHVFGYLHQLVYYTLQRRHNGWDGVSNHQPHDCLLNRLFRRRSKKTPKLRLPGLCVRNSPATGEFPAQMASNAENVSIWWRHHETTVQCGLWMTRSKGYVNLSFIWFSQLIAIKQTYIFKHIFYSMTHDGNWRQTRTNTINIGINYGFLHAFIREFLCLTHLVAIIFLAMI